MLNVIRAGSLTFVSRYAAQMKRNTYIALSLVVLLGVVIIWLKGRSSPHFVGGFSVEDYKEVQKVIRQTMWRRAFPNFSTKTITAAPGSLYGLAISRIEQLDVFEGGTSCRARVRTALGIHLFAMQKSAPKPGQPIWTISSERSSAGQDFIEKIESWRGFAKFPVKGGFGLMGGKLPAVFITPAVYPERSIAATPEGLPVDSNPGVISYERHRLFLPDGSQSPTRGREVILTEGQFSGLLSNRAKLNLRP
jgi:hypothetical protein